MCAIPSQCISRCTCNTELSDWIKRKLVARVRVGELRRWPLDERQESIALRKIRRELVGKLQVLEHLERWRLAYKTNTLSCASSSYHQQSCQTRWRIWYPCWYKSCWCLFHWTQAQPSQRSVLIHRGITQRSRACWRDVSVGIGKMSA